MPGGFGDSPIRLNHDLAGLETWNQDEIERRGMRLAEVAVRVWSIPKLEDEVVELYRPTVGEAGDTHSIADHPHLTGSTLVLFEELRKRILNIDSSVREEIKKLYVAYKSASNFVDVIPQSGGLKLSLVVGIDDLNDPKRIARDVSGIGHWGNGDVEVKLTAPDHLDYAMELVLQAYERQSEMAESY